MAILCGLWVCRCDCGNITEVTKRRLVTGSTRSCGCRRSPQKNLHYTEGTCLEMLRTDTMYKTNTSGVRGVYYSSKRHKWIARSCSRRNATISADMILWMMRQKPGLQRKKRFSGILSNGMERIIGRTPFPRRHPVLPFKDPVKVGKIVKSALFRNFKYRTV